jgi:hypothetical protein
MRNVCFRNLTINQSKLYKYYRELHSVNTTRRYDLQPLEDEYRKLTAQGSIESAQKLRSTIETIRYDLRMDSEVIMEYRDGLEEPLVMRILRNEKDLDRWVEQRFVRLAEF